MSRSNVNYGQQTMKSKEKKLDLLRQEQKILTNYKTKKNRRFLAQNMDSIILEDSK